MEFVFQISPHSDASLIRQVSAALEKRTELYSRARCPGLWRITDRLNRGRGARPISKGQRLRYRLYGILLMGMGIILLVPGLMDPEGLTVPPLAGLTAFFLGLFTLGITGVESKRGRSFDQAAEKLLKGFQAPPPARVRFTGEGMEIAGKPAACYSDFDFVAEMENLFLLTWKEKVTILQKKDLAVGDCPQFSAFLQRQLQERGTFCRLSECL